MPDAGNSPPTLHYVEPFTRRQNDRFSADRVALANLARTIGIAFTCVGLLLGALLLFTPTQAGSAMTWVAAARSACI